MRTTSLLLVLLGLLFLACSSDWVLPGDDDTSDSGETEDEDGDDSASDDSGDGDGSSSDDDDGSSPDDDSDEGTPADDGAGDGDGDGDRDDAGDGDGDGDDNMSSDPYDVSRCDDPNLVWKSGNKTVYESYPDPGSKECEEFNGCKWAGQLAACESKQTEAWIEAHNIVSVFPDFGELQGHDLCLRSGDRIIIATAYDTCGDHDCMGCCTRNLDDADQLIDVEKYTEERWGVEDGPVEWADLGARDNVCD